MKQKVVVEIRGGTLAALYASDLNIEAHIVDWDNIAEESVPADTRIQPQGIADMPTETKEIVDGAGKRAIASAKR
jgi:hypothetical protein